MGGAAYTWLMIALHVERAYATAAVRNVYDLLKVAQKITSKRVHIHTLCEKLHAVKESPYGKVVQTLFALPCKLLSGA